MTGLVQGLSTSRHEGAVEFLGYGGSNGGQRRRGGEELKVSPSSEQQQAKLKGMHWSAAIELPLDRMWPCLYSRLSLIYLPLLSIYLSCMACTDQPRPYWATGQSLSNKDPEIYGEDLSFPVESPFTKRSEHESTLRFSESHDGGFRSCSRYAQDPLKNSNSSRKTMSNCDETQSSAVSDTIDSAPSSPDGSARNCSGRRYHVVSRDGHYQQVIDDRAL
jgi:hypothetical protein